MDKKNNNKLKQYKKKYYTGGRVDMSTGGRVKAAVGGIQKAPMSRKVPPMFIEREEEPMVSTPSTTKQPTFTQAPIESKRPDVVQPQETFIENLDTAANNIDTTFRQAPTTGKGSDQMFIGREGEVRPAMSVKDIEDGRIGDERNEPKDPPNGQATIVRQGFIYAWNGFTYVNTNQRASTDTDTDTDTETELTAEELAAQEKTRRQDVARQSAEAAARGEVPEAAQIPDAEQVGYQRDAQGQLVLDEQGNPIVLKEQQVTTMDPVTRARTDIRAEGQAPEQVTTVDKVETAKTPETITTSKIEDKDLSIVPEQAQVEVVEGDVSDEAIAQAAQVDRVAPIEGADVDIPEGALAERVVGKISEGAKATAAMNAGTSLSRITRAKKQLSRAGLSDADIQEIGNDPEALEDRLADFSEEQRGIIEGLPEEALVSTQINGLLEGMENGEIPVWARPAVAQVEQMLARRGMSASTVGRDNLFNAIIQSAMPIAQSNAQAIQQSVSQQKTIEAQAAEANAQRMQQTALTNAQNVFQMDMSQFSADQQTTLSNSKFMQTVGLTEASNDQQATIQNAVIASQINLAEADFYQRTQAQNAQAFLQMDMQNLANEQQSNVLKAQQTQQRMLSNQSAQNAAAQFNAASENQTQQFMSSLNAQIDQYNTSQMNAVSQFNASQENAAAARDANRAADVEKFNTQLETQIDQFNANQDFARNQWNAQNQAVVEQSNTQWRRNTNTANTAMQNQINAQNAQNSFAMSQTAQSFLWQELRDQADYDFRNSENEKNRIAQLVNTALASDPSKYGGSVKSIEQLIGFIVGDLI
tara:strand:- start:343 stop:2787 length:2445 start_codon:yes stop_codon:yes gene_type:complete